MKSTKCYSLYVLQYVLTLWKKLFYCASLRNYNCSGYQNQDVKTEKSNSAEICQPLTNNIC